MVKPVKTLKLPNSQTPQLSNSLTPQRSDSFLLRALCALCGLTL